MNNLKRIVIVGATSAIAEHCAKLWIHSQPADVTLIGRDEGRIARVAADLRVRSPGSFIRIKQAEFLDPTAIQDTVDSIIAQGEVNVVLIAHGLLSDQEDCQNNLQSCRDALEINGVSPVLFAEAFAKKMAEVDHGTIALIGSVAGDRGRKSNYVYGAAKGLVTRYAQGLQNRFTGTGVRIVLIKPGPTDTPMTAHLKGRGQKLAPVEDVAKMIVRAIDLGELVVYSPKKWNFIMLVIQHLPSFIFNRLSL